MNRIIAVALTLLACQAAADEDAPRVIRADSSFTVTAPTLIEAPATYRPTVPAAAAVSMSAVFPGWGQLATDNGWRAVTAFAFETWFLTKALSWERKAVRYKTRLAALGPDVYRENYHPIAYERYEFMRDNLWWAGGALFIMALDAYVGAHLHGFDRDDVPVPDEWDPAEVPQPIELPSAAPGGAVLMSWSTGF